MQDRVPQRSGLPRPSDGQGVFTRDNKNNKKQINIAGKMRLNEWRGKKDVEFVIEDISLD